MRLWHQDLIHYLPTRQLLGQHRECCALRGKGWGRKHSTVDYVFKYDLAHLFEYHYIVMSELNRRYCDVEPTWYNRCYRGKSLLCVPISTVGTYTRWANEHVYPEHNAAYLRECLLNLKNKGAKLVNGKSIEEMLIDLDLNYDPVDPE